VPKLLACLILPTITLLAQDEPKRVALTEKSNITAADISKGMPKECSYINVTTDRNQSDYTLEAIKKTSRSGLRIERINEFDLTVFDRDGSTLTSVSDSSLGRTLKGVCHAIKTFVMVEIVDTQNMTLTSDTRGDASDGLVGAVVNGTTGRRTHTDALTIYVIVNGEHAVLDCYERSTGCTTIAPGKYYGERKGDGIWVSYRMPITHEPVRNHYKLAGSW